MKVEVVYKVAKGIEIKQTWTDSIPIIPRVGEFIEIDEQKYKVSEIVHKINIDKIHVITEEYLYFNKVR